MAVLIAIIAVFSAGYIGYFFRGRIEHDRRMIRHIRELQEEAQQLWDENESLKNRQLKHLPYWARDAAEDSIAAVLYAIQENELTRVRLNAALDYVQRVRNPKGKE